MFSPSKDLAFGSYRHAVSSLIPEATKIAWKLKEKESSADQPGITRNRKFLYNLSRASYEKEWNDRLSEARHLRPRFMALVLRVFQVGPFKAVAFKPPTRRQPRGCSSCSFNQTLELYRSLIPRTPRPLQLTDMNLDTGGPVVAGQYTLADRAYAQLVQKLASRNVAECPEAMRRNILEFYGVIVRPAPPKRNRRTGRNAGGSRQVEGWRLVPLPATRRILACCRFRLAVPAIVVITLFLRLLLARLAEKNNRTPAFPFPLTRYFKIYQVMKRMIPANCDVYAAMLVAPL